MGDYHQVFRKGNMERSRVGGPHSQVVRVCRVAVCGLRRRGGVGYSWWTLHLDLTGERMACLAFGWNLFIFRYVPLISVVKKGKLDMAGEMALMFDKESLTVILHVMYVHCCTVLRLY